jgi:hypothetical protein
MGLMASRSDRYARRRWRGFLFAGGGAMPEKFARNVQEKKLGNIVMMG